MKTDFICVGAQKAATSWLHNVLSEHPAIVTSTPKELNFFTAHYDRGATWYESFFTELTHEQICGESSPTYFFSADAPVRAQQYNPDMRIIVVLRDPIARAFSNHLHEIRKGHIPSDTSFENGMASNPTYVAQSQYRANLERWLACFDRSQILVLLAEDIAIDPQTAYKAVCAHLDVRQDVKPDAIGERHHQSQANKSKWLQAILRWFGDHARAAGLGAVVKRIKSVRLVGKLLSLNISDLQTEVPQPLVQTRQELVTLFRDDVAFVAEFLERDGLPWQTWKDLQSQPKEEQSRAAE